MGHSYAMSHPLEEWQEMPSTRPCSCKLLYKVVHNLYNLYLRSSWLTSPSTCCYSITLFHTYCHPSLHSLSCFSLYMTCCPFPTYIEALKSYNNRTYTLTVLAIQSTIRVVGVFLKLDSIWYYCTFLHLKYY